MSNLSQANTCPGEVEVYIDKQLSLMPVSVMRNHITTTPHLYFATENSIAKMAFLSSIFLNQQQALLSTKHTFQNHRWTLVTVTAVN